MSRNGASNVSLNYEMKKVYKRKDCHVSSNPGAPPEATDFGWAHATGLENGFVRGEGAGGGGRTFRGAEQ